MADESNMKIRCEHYAQANIKKVVGFLRMFMSETLAKRIVCVVLLAAGITNGEAARMTGFCEKTVKTVKKKMDNDSDDIFVVGGGGRTCKLAGLEREIINEINENEYHSKQQIADMVFEKYGIKVSTEAIRTLLKKNGIRRLKCGSIPSKADPVKQKAFYDEILKPLMKQAKDKTATLLFVDASHFVMGCDFLGCIYGTVRRFVRTCSGRKRYNVLGALNFASKKLTTVTNDTYITATQVCELLRKLAIEYAGMPLYLVLDNANYQKCFLVRELARELGVNLIFIPPYSPNLNLIERYWKFVKGKLRTKYYDDFDVFKNRIDTLVDLSANEYKPNLDSLITENVQLFDCLVNQETNPQVCCPIPQKAAA